MAKMKVLSIATYKTDLVEQFQNFPVKIRDGFENDAGSQVYIPKEKSLCPQPFGFKPRRLIATFHTDPDNGKFGARITYPVPQISQIEPMVAALKSAGAACIDLEGEEWQVIPPGIGNYTPGSGTIALTSGTSSTKTTRTISGISDVLGDDAMFNVRWETDPVDLSWAIAECAGAPMPPTSCFGTTVKPRKLIAYSQTPEGGKIVRSGPVPRLTDIFSCIDQYMSVNGIHCLGYKGESAKRVDLLISGLANPTP